ncbi:MAG: hypothetical protein GWM98_06060, partial [Nitrospinaceae bacterium]|nr:hypothetical protein [Nitrospinaceae bacterium]NIS84542.1 hypothetical protein [Nitrospinaceae bacterium]NIT81334.1 hypothetical protein [Nitrospinaceae bacterium]NIU95740.1 hypothetical protein [Nitrospinaceae bacterium]NIY14465.1 hypothetical protein [Nitrospinaceae bacterium]
EADRFAPEVVDYLKKEGYKLDLRDSFSFYLGAVHAVMKTQTTGEFQGL